MVIQQPADHDDVAYVPVAHQIVARWPVGTFLENLAVLPDGSFVISVHSKNELQRVTRDGRRSVLAVLPAPPSGVIAVHDGVLVAAGQPGNGPGRIFSVSIDGRIEERLTVPDTEFLNGFTPGSDGIAYTVDSIVGVIVEIDVRRSRSRVVLRNERLTKCSAEPMLPGVNGIKAGDGALYLTNTDRALVMRAPFGPDGLSGELEVLAERLRGDDLALDVRGNAYITNHIHNTLIRLSITGERIAIAGPSEGMAGSTACTFHSADATALYVTTTGGIIMPVDGVVQEAKLVRLEVGIGGRPIPLPL
jgi:hypothetical protein